MSGWDYTRRYPTLSYEMRHARRVVAAIERNDADALRSANAVWYDAVASQWRRDHETWLTGTWQRDTASRSPDRIRLMIRVKRMPNLKVVKAGAKAADKPAPKAKIAAAETKAPKAAKAPAPRKFAGSKSGLGVRDFQNQLMQRNFKAKLTDEQLAAAMREEFPSAVAYTVEHVRGIRSAFNKGKHGNEVPEKLLPEFDEAGKAQPLWGEKSAAKKAAKAVAADADEGDDDAEEEDEEEAEEEEPAPAPVKKAKRKK